MLGPTCHSLQNCLFSSVQYHEEWNAWDFQRCVSKVGDNLRRLSALESRCLSLPPSSCDTLKAAQLAWKHPLHPHSSSPLSSANKDVWGRGDAPTCENSWVSCIYLLDMHQWHMSCVGGKKMRTPTEFGQKIYFGNEYFWQWLLSKKFFDGIMIEI